MRTGRGELREAASVFGSSTRQRAGEPRVRLGMSVTSQLCERIADTGYGTLGASAIAAAQRLVLDGIAIAIAGTEQEATHILAADYKEQGGSPQATATANGFRLNTVSAAALNGAAMHVLDFEPMWSPANHALSTTLAGVLALAEARGTDGREVLTALVKGVEMQGWIRQAPGRFEARTTRVHPPGYAIKMFPSQFGTHFGITAALELHPNIPSAAAIRRVVLTAPVMAYVDRPRPKTGLDGKFSLQYTAASALLDGKVGIRTFTDARLAQTDMQDLLGKFEVRLDPAIPGRFEEMHVLLRVELDGGRVLEARCDGPRGKWGTPPISEGEHLVKIRDCLATRLEPAAVERIIELARRINDLDAAGLRQLMQIAGCFV